MPGQLSATARRFREMFADFTTGQKAVTVVAVLAVLLGGVLFATWAAKPTMVPLYSGMESADAAAVVEELSAAGTPYELADGGRTVLVPQADVQQLRLDMSAAGLPQQAPTGYALLDEQGVTTSEFRQRVDFQRALEGELAATISTIDSVQAASVHLVMPEEPLFQDDVRQATASVLLTPAPGKTLDSGQVRAIVHLVSSSVEGLDPTAVTVADSAGNVLNEPGQDGAAAAAQDARSEQTRAFEQQLADSAQDMLDKVLGPGGSVVRVNAVLDYDERTTVTESFETDPEAPAVSESTSVENYTGTGVPVGGVLGPENVELPEGGGDSEYGKEQTERTYAVGKTTEEVTAAPGTVERLSVAVVLDQAAAGTVQTAEVQELVAAAVGLDAGRGDVITIDEMAFDTSAADAAQEAAAAAAAAAEREQMMSMIRTGVILVVVGALVAVALRSLRRRERTPVPIPLYPLRIEEQQRAEQLTGADERGALTAADQPAQVPRQLQPEEARRLAVQTEINDLVERQPDEVAQLLRGWLADRRG